MSDFIQTWQKKLYSSIRGYCSRETADRIMNGYEKITGETDTEHVILWTAEIIRKIESECSTEMLHGIMTACSCPYPRTRLQILREMYIKTGSVDKVIDALRLHFVDSLRIGMLFEDRIVNKLIEWGWGIAGIRDGNRILVTKIPKCGNLRQYMNENDPEKRRQLYCHCPMVRQAVQLEIELPISYCLCGAGYYMQIWETILERKVRVEVIKSVCSGSDKCSFAVHLPPECFN